MDRFLVDYLSSGRAWVFVGSGPSNAMNYPSWQTLANHAFDEFRNDRPDLPVRDIERSLRSRDYPVAFDHMVRELGLPRIRQILASKLKASSTDDTYASICRWPVDVYLTTNYDDEIQQALTTHGESYVTYLNSEDHLAHLVPGIKGAIFKLHGDLRSDTGLILTRSHYDSITHGAEWQYWRTKMTSVFQMNPVVVIGHSLTDTNVRHVLEAAKAGAGVVQPVCWIAPDVPYDEVVRYLHQFRIRVISYDNRDGDHRNLRLYLKRLSEFIPRRTSIRVTVDLVRGEPLGSAGAAGFFVFNRLQDQNDLETTQVAVLNAAVQAAIPTIQSLKEFSLEEALHAAGWPSEISIPSNLKDAIAKDALEHKLFVKSDDKYTLAPEASKQVSANQSQFEHSRARFLSSLERRIKSNYPGPIDPMPNLMAQDICSALVGYFRESGLTLASLLFASESSRQRSPIPVSILESINKASSKYPTLLARQAFITESIAVFSDPSAADKDFLGRVAQGYFGFHALGAFGDTAKERVSSTKDTVWLLDSNIQIAALALGTRVGDAWRECLLRMKHQGVRFFTAERVFDETFQHLLFAQSIVNKYGEGSFEVSAASQGEPPFRKSNLFLQGFTRWVAAGNPLDWEGYLVDALGTAVLEIPTVRERLSSLAIEVVPLHDWPGYDPADLSSREEIAGKIAALRVTKMQSDSGQSPDPFSDSMRKAIPEAESWIVVTQERIGKYHMLSAKPSASKAYFVSDTSILNLLNSTTRITWQPEAFLSYSSSLWTSEHPTSAEKAFDNIVWNLAQQGFTLLEERSVESLLGGIIDQTKLKLTELKKQYDNTLAKKYGESIESVVDRLRPIDQPLAVLQLAYEAGRHEEERRTSAEARAQAEKVRADAAERTLREVDTFRRKMDKKKQKSRAKAKKMKAKAKSKRK